MVSKIRVLSDHTINKIAAGEVIENPASVVKELIENSLDAGADEITVEIKGGGRQLIRVTDNGCGMNGDDALLCLERHATSKLKELEDIHSLDTMGFRGEAIPSIASISKFTLLTRPRKENTAEETQGTMVIADGGKLLKCCPVACSPGTTIEVKSLFFNVPVRKKFQKSPVHDTADIQKILAVLALANPQVKFQLISNQETLLAANLPQAANSLEQLGERIRDVLGSEFFRTTCPLEGGKGEFKLQGFIGLPAHTRPNRTGQFLFINRRGIFSPLVGHAVREGYGTTLSTNRHPVFVLHLSMPGSLVDVNVHPQKREVRLRQELTLKDMVSNLVQEALQKVGFFGPAAFMAFPDLPGEALSPPFTPSPFSLPDASCNPSPFPKFSINAYREDPAPQANDSSPCFPEQPASIHRHPFKPGPEEPELFKAPSPSRNVPKVLGTIPRYILLEPSLLHTQGPKGGLYLLDQRAAHSRIIFEKLCKSFSSQSAEVQALLIPYTLDLTPLEASLILESLPALERMGIHMKEFGKGTFSIDALPQVFGNTDISALIHEIAKNLRDLKDCQAVERERIRQIALAASRAAVSSEKRLSLEEAQSLVNQLMECESPQQCPRGRPTMALLPFEEIAKHFG